MQTITKLNKHSYRCAFLTLCLLTPFVVSAQLPRWAGINQAYTSGGSNNSIREIAADPAGGIIVGGRYNGDLDFIGGTAGFGNSKDGFLAKVNADGSFAWGAGQGLRANDTQVNSVATDANGNVYAVGDFEYTAFIGGGQVVATGNSFDGFLVSYNSSGTKRYKRIFVGADNISPSLVRTDMNGNVVVAGFYDKKVDFGAGNALTTSGFGRFIVSYDTSGAFQWMKDVGNENYFWDMRIGKDGSIFYAMPLNSAGDTITLDGITALPQSTYNTAIVKTDANGKAVWIKMMGTTSNSYSVTNLQLDSAGNLFLSGRASDTLLVDGNTIKNTAGTEGYVVKIDGNGNYVDHIISSVDLTSMAGNSKNTMYLGGGFDGTIDIDGSQATSTNGKNIFVAEMTNDLEINWIKTGGEDGVTTIRVATSSENYVAAVGYFSKDFNLGDSSLKDLGLNNFFTANLLTKELWTGIDEVDENNSQIRLYPNPTNREINILTNVSLKESTLRIYDYMGRVVLKTDLNQDDNKVGLDVTSLSKGIYTLMIEGPTKVLTSTFVKE